jgi:hypothetical protein
MSLLNFDRSGSLINIPLYAADLTAMLAAMQEGG